MCRLLAVVSPQPATVSALIGNDQLAQFTELSCVHGDGWGTAWCEVPTAGAEPVVRSSRSPTAAAEDPEFTAQTTSVAATARMLHLRWATAGYAVALANTHPFTVDGVSFAHNGSLSPVDSVEQRLLPESRQLLTGDTDSERYFALIRQEARGRPHDLFGAVSRAVTALRLDYPHASLNALLLTVTELIIVHASPRSEPASAAPATVDSSDTYYLMFSKRFRDGTLAFASSGLDTSGWTPLPPESVTRVDLATLQQQVELIAGAPPSALVSGLQQPKA